MSNQIEHRMIDHRLTRNTRGLLQKGFCLIALGLILALIGCRSTSSHNDKSKSESPAATGLSLIPAPYLLQRSPGYFILGKDTVLSVRSNDAAAEGIAHYFSELVQRTRGAHLDLLSSTSKNNDAQNGIDFVVDPRLSFRDDETDEGYQLTVAAGGIALVARDAHGLFNGAVTLWQLLTPDGSANLPLRIPCLHIEDHPRFVWRGLMLDPARHMQSPEFVKQFIDWMALHKLNVLHWHLTDDQGWRIEIKKYPKLTDIGAWRQPAGAAGVDSQGKPVRYGGYYTQEQIRDIVAYAQQRYVTIVPEIEMPGHAQAAIAAYPELGVTGKNPGVSRDWGVHTVLYNVEDSTFTFLQDVLSEVMYLFPSKYIHIGGDEAAKDQWQASARVQARMRELGIKDEIALQAYFTAHIEKFLSAHGRKLIGWDEILEGGLPPQATVMSWRGTKGAIEAAKQGHDVVLAPDPDLYFDHLSGDLPDEPAGRPKVISPRDIYAFNPIPQELDAAQATHVLGAQANLWSEYFPTDASVARATYPRAAALAEVLWSPLTAHDWNGFLDRLVVQQARYRELGLGYAQSAFAVHIDTTFDARHGKVGVKLTNQTDFGTVRYTLDGSAPTPQSPRYEAPLETAASGEVRATAFAHDVPLADARARKLDPLALLHRSSAELLQCHPDSGVILRLPDDTPPGPDQAVFHVDLFDPCWLWPDAGLDNIDHLAVDVGSIPFNFQLWKDMKSVVTRKPLKFPAGELQVHLDRCDGDLLAAVALTPALAHAGTTRLEVPIGHHAGTHSLCLRFATGKYDPLWAIDRVQLVPAH